MTHLENYLGSFTESDWNEAINTLLPCIHEVDRNAVRIWFRFYPLSLIRAIESAEDRESMVHSIVLQGDLDLSSRIDTSHHFLYGHRYWPTVKAAVEAEAAVFTNQTHGLAEEIKQVAILVAEKLKVDRALVNAVVAVGLATLNQVGLDAFKAAPGKVETIIGIMAKTPQAVIAERAKDDSQGLFGFLKTVDKKFTVTYDNLRNTSKFPVIDGEEIASASAKNLTGKFKDEDERCWEGVIPVECKSASCGTCWVGVLGGQDKLSEVSRRERRQLKVFGYLDTDEPKPYIRLACQAKASGNVSIAIPTWNAVFGKKLYGNIDELELEPVTTSARALRETIATAAKDE
jgi:ferredoxin